MTNGQVITGILLKFNEALADSSEVDAESRTIDGVVLTSESFTE